MDRVDASFHKKLLHLNLSSIKPMGKGKNVEEIIESLKLGSQNLDSTNAIEAFLEDLRDLKLFLIDLSARLNVIRKDDEELFEIIGQFVKDKDKVKKDFMLVNENFQSGKDYLATEILTDAVGRLNSLISALVSLQSRHTENKWSEILIDGKSLGELTSSLNETLNGIASAMEKRYRICGRYFGIRTSRIVGRYGSFLGKDSGKR